MSAYLWRKYECGVPARVYTGQVVEELEHGLLIWPGVDQGQHPKLNRWQNLGPAFFGFVSRGMAPPHACVYLAAKVREIAEGGLVHKTWIEGADAAAVYDWMVGNLVGVWMGDKTPYLMTEDSELWSVFSCYSGISE